MEELARRLVVDHKRDGRVVYDEQAKANWSPCAPRPERLVSRLARECGVNANQLGRWIRESAERRQRALVVPPERGAALVPVTMEAPSSTVGAEGRCACRLDWAPAVSLTAARQRSAQMSSDFYDRLAPFYHLLYGDWDAAVRTQGEALARLLHMRGVEPGEPVLDAACGIGTQALGLLARGYAVDASDLSPGAVARLRQELDARGLRASVRVDDLRTLQGTADCSCAAVLVCDNSLPHLLTDAEILQALRNAHRVLRPGGWLVLSVRDYGAIERRSPDVRPYGLHLDRDGTRFLAVQVWEWDRDCYDLRMYLTTEQPDGRCTTQVLTSRYYAVTTDRLQELMSEAGLFEVQRLDNVLFQPVLVGRRAETPA